MMLPFPTTIQFDTAPDGQTYAERYGVTGYPHLAIIDPRTGRLVWRKEGWTQEHPMTPEHFAEMAMGEYLLCCFICDYLLFASFHLIFLTLF